MNTYLKDPFFWALVATLAIVLEFLIFIPRKKYKKWVYALGGITALSGFEISRLLIPFLPQPRISISPVLKYSGMFIFFLGIFVAGGAFIQIMKAKKENWKLRTGGFYSLVRHPMYFGDILWNLGWCIYWKSLVGIALTPVWIFLRLTLAVLEEEKLIEKYKETYLNYTRKVKFRIIPFLV